MNAFPIWTLVWFVAIGWLGWGVLNSARRQRRRAVALSEHARHIPVEMIEPLHDHLLEVALAHYAERELRAGKLRLIYAVALRDRLDELAGREHGALNKARIGSRLLPAAYRLRGDPNPLRVRDFRDTFLLTADASTRPNPRNAEDDPPVPLERLEAMVQGFDAVHRQRH